MNCFPYIIHIYSPLLYIVAVCGLSCKLFMPRSDDVSNGFKESSRMLVDNGRRVFLVMQKDILRM
jgi:hypothetical protein